MQILTARVPAQLTNERHRLPGEFPWLWLSWKILPNHLRLDNHGCTASMIYTHISKHFQFKNNQINKEQYLKKKKKKNRAYSSSWNSPQNYGTPLVNGITQCYLPPDRGNRHAFTPTGQVGTRFIDPVRMKGWVGLVGWLHTEMVYPSTDGHPSEY